MSKLYAVLVRHVAPKSHHESIETYVIADDEETVRDRIDREFAYGRWADKAEEGETYDVEDENGDPTGEEIGYLEYLLTICGDINDEQDDSLWDDAFYGKTHWGWKEVSEIDDQNIPLLLSLGVAQDWREPPEATDGAAGEESPSAAVPMNGESA